MLLLPQVSVSRSSSSPPRGQSSSSVAIAFRSLLSPRNPSSKLTGTLVKSHAPLLAWAEVAPTHHRPAPLSPPRPQWFFSSLSAVAESVAHHHHQQIFSAHRPCLCNGQPKHLRQQSAISKHQQTATAWESTRLDTARHHSHDFCLPSNALRCSHHLRAHATILARRSPALHPHGTATSRHLSQLERL